MNQFLHIDYKPTHSWAHRLLVSLNSSTALKVKHAEWSRLRVSALTFSIETRLGALREIIKQVDGYLNILDNELKRAESIDKYIAQKSVYPFGNEPAVRSVLIGASCFIAESRSCFENLACFYREFLRHYFAENVSKAESYEKVVLLTHDSRWADDLNNLRNNIIHDQTPWLAFLVRNNPPPKYEPILVFNYTAQALTENDYVPFETLRRIYAGLQEAVQTLAQNLANRVGPIEASQ